MSDTVIAVENLSKRYLVEHKPGGKGYKNYTALRDVVGYGLRNFARKAVDVADGRHVPQGCDIEDLGAQGYKFRRQGRRGRRHHRPQWGRKSTP